MRKAMTVILWLGLMVCAIMLISLSGQKYALRREVESEARKNQVLQTLYDQMKDEWAEKETALTQEKNALLRDAKATALERDALAEALKAAQQETQALAAERETASGRLSEVLSMLRGPVQELPEEKTDLTAEAEPEEAADKEAEAEPEENRSAQALTPPLPKRGVQPVPFAE